ncbi:MAG: lipopolysaccharide heptosyltransferase II [Deltaproteobacteria bacterium RBG_13_61_14]|nr:MAG: lipopolysaccharide heptosyltransferase II [Deltaproteobacteria bacterium RBG_13_61_14]
MPAISPRQILVIRLGRLGDVVLATPLVRALRQAFPQAQVDWVIKQEFASLLQGHPWLHLVIPLDTSQGPAGLFRLAGELRRRRYDLVLDLHGIPRSYLLSGWSAAGMRRRYRKWPIRRRLLTGFGWNLLRGAPSVAERYFTAVEDFGIAPDQGAPELMPGAEARQESGRLLAPWPRPRIGLAPGATRFTKRWPAESFAAVGADLAERFSGSVVVVGGPEDRETAQEILNRMSPQRPKLDLTGRLTLPQAVAVIQDLDLLISNDTGLMHVATAVQTPVVAVFGPTTRELGFFPLGPAAKVIEHQDLSCRPCSVHGSDSCPRGHFRCMKEITPEQVNRATAPFLAKG